MDIHVRQDWLDLEDRLEKLGVDVSVVGRPGLDEQAILERALLLLLDSKSPPAELSTLKLSPGAVTELRKALVALLKGAAARAARAGRRELSAEDVSPPPAR